MSRGAEPRHRAPLNLLLLVLAGTLISAWLAVFTDALPTISSVWGIGGVLAWIAFVAGVLTEETRKALQKKIETAILDSALLTVFIGLVCTVLLVFAFLHGTIDLQSGPDSVSRVVTIAPVDEGGRIGKAETASVAGGSERKIMLLASFQSRYRVKASGLPPLSVDLTPYTIIEITSPAAFWNRPVLLLRLSPDLAATALQENLSLRVALTRRGHSQIDQTATVSGPEFVGQAVWVGTDADTAVPPDILQRWQVELMTTQAKIGPERWLPTLAVLPDKVLASGDRVDVTLVNTAGVAAYTGRYFVRTQNRSPHSVQVVRLFE